MADRYSYVANGVMVTDDIGGTTYLSNGVQVQETPAPIAPPVVASVGASGGGLVTSINWGSYQPTGKQVGDLLVALMGARDDWSVPSGWNLREEIVSGASAYRMRVMDRIATGDSGDGPTVTLNSETRALVRILRVTGAPTAGYYDVSDISAWATNTTHTLPTIDTTVDNALLLAFAVTDGASTTSDPATWDAKLFETNTGGGSGVTVAGWPKAAGAAGSYGGETFGVSFNDQASKVVIAYSPTEIPGVGGDNSLAFRRRGRRPIGGRRVMIY